MRAINIVANSGKTYRFEYKREHTNAGEVVSREYACGPYVLLEYLEDERSRWRVYHEDRYSDHHEAYSLGLCFRSLLEEEGEAVSPRLPHATGGAAGGCDYLATGFDADRWGADR